MIISVFTLWHIKKIDMTDHDSYLWHQVQQNNEHAFETIFGKHFAPLCNYAIGLIGNKSIAEDITEDCFLKLWQQRDTITVDTSLKAYLYRIVRNRCINFMEHEMVQDKYLKRKRYILYDKELKEPVYANSPHQNLVSKELELEIENALNALPVQCRKIFEMNRFEGLKYKEIAKKLDISITTVKTQMNRALTKLRLQLKDYLP